ncbi:MAG: hypothetical protein HUJ69_03625 [Lachnospiraceae bacterium]|nr:hypothetical protein [Lachnospiraceae bacterium]
MKRYVVMELSDSLHRDRLKEFLNRHYGESLCVWGPGEEISGERDGAEEMVTVAYFTDRVPGEEERRKLEEKYFPVLTMEQGEELDLYQSGHGIAKAVFSGIIRAERARELAARQTLPEDFEDRSPDWLSVTEKKTEEEQIKQEYKGRAYLVSGAAGGLGVTTLAAELAKVFGTYGRTLLLDLCSPSSWSGTGEEEGGLSELIYSFLAEPKEVLEDRVEEFCQQQDDGIWGLRPAEDPRDLWTLRPEEGRALTQIIRSHFDYVIIDGGRGWNPMSLSWKEEGAVGCLVSGTDRDFRKDQRVMKMEGPEVYLFLQNRGKEGKGRNTALKDPGSDVFILPERETGSDRRDHRMPSAVEDAYGRVIREAVGRME